MSVCLRPLQLEELQPQVLQSINSGAPLTVQLNATTYNMTYPLVIDLSQSQFKNISVTITGQGPNQTILDCQGVGRAVLILGAGSVSISNLTIQNCDTTRSLPGYPPMPTPVYDGAWSNLCIHHCTLPFLALHCVIWQWCNVTRILNSVRCCMVPC